MVKISVIVPVYNVEKYLSKCLESLVNQTLQDIEIIVVNDGSLDNSQDIINEFVAKYPNKVKSAIKENGGQGSARNVGLDIATGEYIGYVDSDDYVKLDMYEKMYNKALEDGSDIVIAGAYAVSPNEKILQSNLFKCDKQVTTIEETPEILFDLTSVCNKIYKSKLLKYSNVKFRSKKWYEDFDFSVAILMLSNKISIVNECFYYYLSREGSTMNNSNVERNLEILDAMDEIIKFTKQNNLYEKYKAEVEYLAILHIYLPTNVRIIRAKADRKLKRKTINRIFTYMTEKFPNFRKNKYITKLLPSRKKPIFILMNMKAFDIIYAIFKLKDLIKMFVVHP